MNPSSSTTRQAVDSNLSSKVKKYTTEWEDRACDICGESNNLKVMGIRQVGLPVEDGLFVYEHHDTICLNCGFVFNGKLPSQDFIDEYYQKTKIRVGADYDPVSRLNLIKSKLKPGSAIIEFGGGNGEFAELLKSNEYDVDSIEFNDIVNPGNYDCALAYYLIEHVREPRQLVYKMRMTLKRDGLIIIEAPNLLTHSRHSFYLEHLSHFTINHLAILLTTENFQILEVHQAHSRNFGFAIVAKKGLTDRLIDTYDKTMEEIGCHWHVD